MTDAAASPSRLAVFTDLDGTLLDHASYSPAAARLALTALARARVPLVLASSKTAAEIEVLHAVLGLGAVPAIVENGAGIWRPGAAGRTSAETKTYTRLRAALDALPAELRAAFRGFGDMSASDVAKITGLPRADATRAKARAFSEPGLIAPDAAPDTAPRLIAALAKSGVTARQGGRFLTLSFGHSKADRMAEITAELGARRTLALGDAPNDIEMLEAADFGVIVANPHGPAVAPLPGEATGRVIRTTAPGPAGWNTAVLAFLARYAGATDPGSASGDQTQIPPRKGASPHG